MGRFRTAEHGFAILLAAVLSGLLTLAFAIGIVCSLGIHAPLDYSVFVVSAGSLLLADVWSYPLNVDNWRETMRYPDCPVIADDRPEAA
jgi:hypothetical protein